ncbi:EamA family transporter [Lachnospiraceae bacterium MD335]|nr:EamA family transporter [Lachnospiraceae bacterium MD335]
MGTKIKNIILLQGVVVIYTLSGIMSKNASANGAYSVKFLTFFALEFLLLAVYAVLWQQMIKRFELSVAYANRSMAVLWSMLWAVLFFHDEITVKNIIGVVLVTAGTVIINTDVQSEEGEGRQ